MNDWAREQLVQAQLAGVKQIKGYIRDNQGGYCAMGWISERQWRVQLVTGKYQPSDITAKEASEIMTANDLRGWDFLTIARKCCLPDGGSES